jgi:hypothetical protein
MYRRIFVTIVLILSFIPSGFTQITKNNYGTYTVDNNEVATITTGVMSESEHDGLWDKFISKLGIFSGSSTITGSASVTGLMLMPTAYRLDKQKKLNIDFTFIYYIGEFWKKIKNKTDIFTPINWLFCSGELKYTLINETRFLPCIAIGYQKTIGIPCKLSSVKHMRASISQKSRSLSGGYCVLSKQLRNIEVHIGYKKGKINKLLNAVSGELELSEDEKVGTIIAGINISMFDRLISIEVLSPVIEHKRCVFVSTFIDKFLPFNIAYLNLPDGYSVIGYFGVRLTAFPSEKK